MSDQSAQDTAAIPSVTKFEDDVKADATAEVRAAKSALSVQITDAQTALDKMLDAAAGDVVPAFTDAEAAAIPFLAFHAGPYASSVSQFGSLVLGAVSVPLNTEVDNLTKIGLQHAKASLAALAASAENALK